MITIFAVPKKFEGHISIIQRNAILSWMNLEPRPEIILLGQDEGVSSFASEHGLEHIKGVATNSHGTPLISDIFEKAQRVAKHDILAYVNADIILMRGFLEAIAAIKVSPFLMVGRRRDLDLKEPITFERTDWEDNLKKRVAQEGKLHGFSGIDYFVFTKGCFGEIPPFAIGRTSWDNWLLHRAWSRGASLIDATKVVTIVHQNHTYFHHPQGKVGVWKGEEAKINLKLAGGLANLFSIRDADFTLTESGLEKKKIDFYRIFSLPFRYFKKSSSFLKPLLFPGYLFFVLWRKIKISK